MLRKKIAGHHGPNEPRGLSLRKCLPFEIITVGARPAMHLCQSTQQALVVASLAPMKPPSPTARSYSRNAPTAKRTRVNEGFSVETDHELPNRIIATGRRCSC